MTEGKKVVKKPALKTPRLRSVIQKGDTAGKVSNVIGKWKMKANKSKETLLVPVEEVKIPSAMRNLHHLKIRREDLDRVRQNTNPVKARRLPPRLQQVVVRRTKKTDKSIVTYAVLKPANEDFVLPPVDVTNHAGPRFDCEGNFISYSILGSLSEFKRVAKERGEFNELFAAENAKTATSMKKVGEQQCSSLKLWKDRINEWNEIHRTLSQRSKRPVEDLLMRTPNEYPEIVNQRAVIEMALETSCGCDQKRENANFFKLRNTIGKGDCSVFSTLGKSVTNEYTPVEIFQVPDVIDQEKGSDTPSLRRGYPVYHTPYLQTRASEIQESTHMFIPQAQQLKQLQVVGVSFSKQMGQERLIKKLESSIVEPVESQNGVKTGQQDVGSKYPIGFTGPALMVGNQLIKWEGHGLSQQGQIGIKTFIVFDGNQNECLHNRIRLENVGTTRLVYDLTRAPVRNSFDIPRSKEKRFFLLSEGGVLAASESLMLPVICKSKTPGIFQESWAIKTSPVLGCGSDIIVNFKAIIHSTENYTQKFAIIEEKLLQNKAMTIVREVVSRLVDSICSPDPPATPTSEYISEEEQFNAENQGLLYHSTTIRAMENYHSFLTENIPVIPEQYRDFSLSNLRKSIIIMTDIEEGELDNRSPLIAEMDQDLDFTKRRLQWRYLRQMNNLGCAWPEPSQNLRDITFRSCRAVLASIFDRFSDRSTSMAVFLNLPMKSDGDQVEKTVDKKNNHKGGKQRSNQVVSKVKKGKDAPSPMRARTPTQTPSIVRKSAVSPSMDDQPNDVMESFIPGAKEREHEKEKLNFYSGKLQQIMYAELSSAIDKMMVLCDGEI